MVGLILDTEELLTTDALISSSRFQREQIIIPNPCKEESAKISDRCPGIVIRQCTTHELFSDNCTPLREIMGTDRDALRFIFLDYNGRRVHHLFSFDHTRDELLREHTRMQPPTVARL
jgi:hypothetical protein